MSKLVSVALAAAAALAAVSTSTPLFAAEPELVYHSAAVSYRDLNLANLEGQAQLHRRVRAAVRQVCGVAESPSVTEHQSVRSCRTAAFDAARPQVDQVLAGYRPQVIIAASR